MTIWIALCFPNQYFHIWSTAVLKSHGCHKYFSGNLFLQKMLWRETWNLVKTDLTAAFQLYSVLMCVINVHMATCVQWYSTRWPSIDHSRAQQICCTTTLCSDIVFLYFCFARVSLQAEVQFHCIICMSGVSQRGCRMTSGPTDPQSCCHPSSPRSPSWMVWSPSNRGQSSLLMDQRLLGNQSIRLSPT